MASYNSLKLTKTLAKDFFFQQNVSLVAESFIRGRSTNPVTSDMKLFAKIVNGCKIWIWMLDVIGLITRSLFI